jgi:hypothetical protein
VETALLDSRAGMGWDGTGGHSSQDSGVGTGQDGTGGDGSQILG